MEVKKIQKFILKNPKLSNKQISNKLGISVGRVAGSVSALKRSGKLNASTVNEVSNTDNLSVKIKKALVIELAKRKGSERLDRNQIVKKSGASLSSVYRWIKEANVDRNSESKTSKKELKKIVVELSKQNLHHDEIVAKSGASMSSVYRWLGKTNKKSKVKKVVKVKAIKGDFTNADGVNKEIARNKMAKYIIDADKSGVILSLPFSTCNIEKKILVDAPNTTFLGVEKLPIVYKDLKNTVKAENLPIETYCGKLSDKIYGESEDTYSHIIADYCGNLGKYGKEIEYAVRNKIIVKGGIMALTFSKPIRGGKDAKKLLAFGGTITNNIKDNRCASDKAIEIFFNRIIGNSFKFLEIFNYSDDKKDAKGNGFPMVLIILKRKN